MRKKLFFFNSDFRAIVRKPSVVAQSHRRRSLLIFSKRNFSKLRLLPLLLLLLLVDFNILSCAWAPVLVGDFSKGQWQLA